MCSLIGLPFSLFLCLDSKITHFSELFSSEMEILSRVNNDFTSLFFPFINAPLKAMGRLFKFFILN